ncbi:diphosphate--fructose-6-phosphate 1-phosphotransferase [Guptibacillus hwajinpoensis]|uniref:diphosphate--fructose-6-phosphate 1-phosphotransferase n=1 Tax=Guptibacillus hwajinpoensis TaxID=208199 RepID=UPI002740296B|nr:diphosphate--fructose-6-phosphate 1-phosphotransferase [Pseudalkalibacillus hwajinpoensis]WLR61360.1 diphosphate--fructose-6-phosphate 1-phosphotransferase [Pseudalkalibacillus hwajinpoensis]
MSRGACLGSGRFPLTDEHIENGVRLLQAQGVDVLVFIGGNGTMEALAKVEAEARRQNVSLQVLGLPKTVDNDLGGTDHAPGFGSSARYVAQATRDMSRDLASMQNFEKVRVLETMGRNAGWLAAASGLLQEYEEDSPHFIAIPERPIKKEVLLENVNTALNRFGYATVVVSEGVLFGDSGQVERGNVDGRAILGGISSQVAHFLKNELSVMTRAELLGMNQRSFSAVISDVDREEAYTVGRVGAEWIREGSSNVMVSIQRNTHQRYSVRMLPIELEKVVAAGERVLPDAFIQNKKAYYEWLKPLIGEDLVTYPPPIKGNEIYVD